ncbi:ABC transporter permease [Nonomuraea jiangxiensis]|uniref:Putative ABC transport system permease protein n=1 Tax=Nonomuraea jiangxiensis TaxID=633440 RepID=A0A1G9QUS2_9ACTN|nr:ABC transporter permease [Nonomuraea jiangxiensis]SDM14756.1 putative ABC transport system permease protein [Nonomuraea jiangxiensis]
MSAIAWKTLLRRPGALLGAFLMIVIGASLISAFSLIRHSAVNAEPPVERYRAVPVAAGGTEGLFTPDAVDRVRGLSAVQEVVPELTFTAIVLDAGGQPVLPLTRIAQFGHGWSSAKLTPFALSAGRAPAGDGEVVLDRELAAAAGVSPGDSLGLLVAGAKRTYRLAGIAEPAGSAGPLAYQRTLFFADEHAAELAGRGAGRVDGLGVFVRAGADPAAVAAAIRPLLSATIQGDAPGPAGLPTLQVLTGADRGVLEGSLPDDRATGQTMGMLTAIVALMAVTVISGALITSVRRRSRQLALLRAVGGTPGQIRVLCCAEALLLSLLGGLAGSLVGLGLAELLVAALRSREVFNPAFRVVHSVEPLVLALAITLVAGQVAAWLTARSALRIRPAEALTNASAVTEDTRRSTFKIVFGVLALAGAGVIQVLGMSGLMPPALRGVYGVLASGLVMIGIGLVGSWIVYGMARLGRVPVARLSPVGGYLAAANVRFKHRRYAGVVAPLAVGVALAGWALSSLPLYTLSMTEEAADRVDADFILRTPLVRETYVGLSEDVRKAAANLPGVTTTAGLWEAWAQATPSRPGQDGSLQDTATYATIVTGAAGDLLDLQVRQGALSDEGVAVGAAYARQRGISLGERVQVRVSGAAEPIELPVVAVFALDKGGQEGLVLPGAALAGHVAAPLYDRILVRAESAGDPALSQRLDALAGQSGLVKVETPAEFRREYAAERSAATSNIGILAVVLVGGFLLLAAVIALVLSAADRAGEFHSFRQINAAPRQISLMVVWEMVLTVVPAWVLGVAATGWMALLMAGGNVEETLRALPTGTMAVFGAAALITAVAGCLLTSRTAMRSLNRFEVT